MNRFTKMGTLFRKWFYPLEKLLGQFVHLADDSDADPDPDAHVNLNAAAADREEHIKIEAQPPQWLYS